MTTLHPTVARRVTFFYALGNTPPVCLTQTLAPEEPTKALLLGAGDPRNILHTISSGLKSGKSFTRTSATLGLYNGPDRETISDTPLLGQGKLDFDFTCCDIEPAVFGK